MATAAGATGEPFWSVSESDLVSSLTSDSARGLSAEDAKQRLARYGGNLLKPKKRSNSAVLFLNQFRSPLIILLLIAAAISAFVGDPTDAGIIIGIVLVSGLLGFWQERRASDAVAKLLAIVETKASVIRDGLEVVIPTSEVVPGDITTVAAGDVIPGDARIISSRDLFVDEATLTGETYPVEKNAGSLGPQTPLAARSNSLFMGTHVVSGTGLAIVARTGPSTEFGKVSETLRLRPPETEFEHGIKRFGLLLMEITLLLVIAIFAINVALQKPILDSFLFSLALAVGLTPQLLPAIVAINLANGAKRMADAKVIVKRLSSIENFGSMNVLCSDKTGTLTQAIVELKEAADVDGKESEKVRFFAALNSHFQTGFTNPIDEAIQKAVPSLGSGYSKLDEVPYDFVRKRLTILVRTADGGSVMISKGAYRNIRDVCSSVERPDGTVSAIDGVASALDSSFEEYGHQGYRVLGLAYKNVSGAQRISKDDEKGMVFLGFLVLFDPIKPGLKDTLVELKRLGVNLKVITGDNAVVAKAVTQTVGIQNDDMLTGPELRQMSNEALISRVNQVNVFAEVEPNQKERIILALKKSGNVVGYMGDGINDASALHAADVGISVDSAVDVAKEAADIVLLEKDLNVLNNGVAQGRRTFANTMKYVFMATSANFGNMFSMAGASLFLSFLPMLPKQVLLTNLLTDFPETTIATDNVDPEMIDRPRKWDMKFIRRFMLVFGLISSIFDYATFSVLIFVLNASETQFQTGWFVESVTSAAIIVLVIRTRRSFIKSRPGRYLLSSTFAIVVAT
ncbi:MAG TPA: magnesium-translocating P-type ATPase, partial [Methanomassiliicoccales archaeon]|nr:magnesium-translocating P-type ATPase [Methanomassiliicoccales archaeon]